MINELTIPCGYVGTEKTIREMWKLVNTDFKAESLRNIAVEVVRNVPPKDYFGEADALFRFVKGTIKYQRDPEGAERIADSFVTLQDRVGDCDDHAILLASMAKSIGLPVRFATLNSRMPDDPLVFNHVYAEIGFDDVETGEDGIKWLAADTTEPESYLGWNPEPYYFKKIWDDPLNHNITEGAYMGYRMSGRVALPYRTDGMGSWYTDIVNKFGTAAVEKAVAKVTGTKKPAAPSPPSLPPPPAKKKILGLSVPVFIGGVVGVTTLGIITYLILRKKKA